MPVRPDQVPQRPQLTEGQILAASYVGSPEHKARRWWGGFPGARLRKDGSARRPKKQQTTICPLVEEADKERATGWVRTALRTGQVLYLEGDQDYPARIWYRDRETGGLWIGYCTNQGLGQYKGWPIGEDERIAVFG
jgi:hypothetical protein